MANFVLVHTAWGGIHFYANTEADLRAAGHEVLRVELTGLGSRQAELHRGITLTDHVNDVCEQVERAGFESFILAGHGYGGMVITGAAARLGGRIDAICYIDAFLPDDGQSLWDVAGPYENGWHIDQQKFTPGLVPMLGSDPFEVVPGIMGYQPLLTVLEAVRYTGEEAKIPRRSYIIATGWHPSLFARFAEKVRDDPAWEYHEAPCRHLVMLEQPELLRDVLLGLAG
jgi:pimeloyl-ACP methyl ester carboxylesterase